jgi:TM2 domain-containing membrane protein YozV
MERVKVAGGLRCPYCHDRVVTARGGWVACAACLARHHAECWGESGACGACGDGRSAIREATVERSSQAPAANPGIAAALSFVYAGLGQIYSGRVLRGILIACGFPVVLVLAVVAGLLSSPFVLVIGAFAFWVWQIFDAFSCASAGASAGRPARGPIRRRRRRLSKESG